MRETTTETRRPAVAGTFYPAGEEDLRSFVEKALAEAEPPRGVVRAVIGPHAGYRYSGALCGRAYAAVDRRPGRVWLLGPSHHVPLDRAVGCSHERLETPLGGTRVDRDAMDLLAGECGIEADDEAHAPEHALETHLPFLQVRWPEATVVPLLTASREADDLPGAVTRFLRDDDLIAVSSDLSHFEPDVIAKSHDRRTAHEVEALRPEGVDPDGACGWVAVRALLRIAALRGWRAERLGLATSGDVAGDRGSVVGYGAWRFVEPEGGDA